MNIENNDQPQNDDHLSAWQSFFNPLAEEYKKMLIWVKPDSQKNILLELIKLLYKLPIAILVTLLTPVAFIVMVVVFFATF